MKNIRKIAKEIMADAMKEDVTKFIEDNPNPSDDEFHEFAEEKDHDVHDAEAKAYELATEAVFSPEKE